jgi:adenylate cyclase
VDDARAWEEAGLYVPESSGATERLALLEFLTQRGATIAQMVEAHAAGRLPGVAGDLVIQGAPMAVVSDLAARSGLPVPLVLRALLAAGIPARADSEAPEEVSVFLEAFEEGASIMGEEATLAFIRVLGAAANNIAEAAVALFFTELGPGTVREGPDELARAELAEAATLAFTRVPDVVAGMVLHAFERAQRRVQTAYPQVWPGDDEAPEAMGPTEVVALGFVDLVGSTPWAQSLPLREQSLALTRFESAAWSSAVLAGGRVIKMIGDEVFFAAPSADAACRIALEVCEAAAADHVLPPARGAVGIGSVAPREGDYFGPMVNLLARLVKAAPSDGVVVTEAVADALSLDEWDLQPLEPAAFRGIESPVQAFHVKHQGPAH